jgi:hypothetical protein
MLKVCWGIPESVENGSGRFGRHLPFLWFSTDGKSCTPPGRIDPGPPFSLGRVVNSFIRPSAIFELVRLRPGLKDACRQAPLFATLVLAGIP